VVVEFAHEHENTIWRYQLVRTDVSATNCTSGRKCSNRLDVIVCDVSYDGSRCYYSVIIRMVHKYHIVHIHIVHMVSRASSLLLLFLSFVSSVLFVLFPPLILLSRS